MTVFRHAIAHLLVDSSAFLTETDGGGFAAELRVGEGVGLAVERWKGWTRIRLSEYG